MSLPWVRLDSNIASHDKVLALLADPSPRKWQAFASFMCSLGYCNGHGTNGRVPKTALPFIHGTPQTATLLVKYGLWTEQGDSYFMPKFVARQVSSETAEAKRTAQKLGGVKGACIKHHGPDCNCWMEEVA